jgi:hypothetical protein
MAGDFPAIFVLGAPHPLSLPGLDPAIHGAIPLAWTYGSAMWPLIMDARVKPGHDAVHAALFGAKN